MNTKRVWAILLILLVFLIPVHWVEAQGPGETGEPGEIQGADRLAYDLTLLDLDYGEQILEGNDTYTALYLYLPDNVVPYQTGSYLDLVFSHTTPQTGKQASLTITLNGSLLKLIPLTPENADEQSRVRLEVPGDLWQPGSNRLVVRLNTGIRCGETETTTLIVAIHEESLIHLEYDLPFREPDLGVYPLPFYERTFLPSEVYFVLPQKPTVVDISTAASISAGLGMYSQGQVQVSSVLETELTDDIRKNHHLVVIGRPDTNGLLAELDLPLSLEIPQIKDDSGVLQELVSPWNPSKIILVITGRNDLGLIKAADTLNRPSHFLGMKGPVAVVYEVLPPPQTPTQREIDITFDALGYEDETFYGVRPQEERYYFWMPLSWQMSEEPKLFLSFNHSTAIDPEQSTLDVELNGVPVGGALLDSQNAINGVLEIELPTWLLEPDTNRLDVNVGMVMGDYCTNLNNHQAWTVIRRDSFLNLPYVEEKAPLDLSLFPYPFDVDANLTNVSIVLPDVLNRLERDRLLQLAVMLGHQAGGDHIALRAMDAREADKVKQTNHLIVVGRPTRNALISELNAYLPQPFQANTDQLIPKIDSVIFVETNTRNAGLIQELASPWNPDMAILVITGTTDEGVTAAYDLLLGNVPELVDNVELAGNLAVIEGERVYSVDTRLLSGQPQQSARVQPVAQPGAAPRRELVSRWW